MGLFGSSSASPSPQDQVDRRHLEERVARLEAAVARLEARLATVPGGVDGGAATAVGPEPAWLQQVRDLKAQGKVIEAIKAYRGGTGAGLREAKEAVEALP